jgi:hypothetical protein
MNKAKSIQAGERTQKWHIAPGQNCFYILNQANNYIVAKTIGDSQEDQANANLLAAAPELLDACEAIEAAGPQHDRECECEFCEAFVLIRAAIAKAEGKEIA